MKIIPKSWVWRLVMVGILFFTFMIIVGALPKKDVYWKGINISQCNRDLEKFNNTPTLQLYRESLERRYSK